VFYLGLVVSSLLIIYGIIQINFSGMPQVITSIQFQWLIPVLLWQIANYIFRALRICKILAPIKIISLGGVFRINAVGFMAVALLPAHTGIILRAFLISKKEKISTTSTMGVIVVEKIFDIISAAALLLLLFLISTPEIIAPGTLQVLKDMGVVLIILVLVTLIILCFCFIFNDFTHNFLVKTVGRFSKKTSIKIQNYYQFFTLGLSVIKDARQIVVVAACSVLVWVATIIYYYCILKMLGVGVSIEIALLVTLALIISAAVPSAPGLIGTFHAAVVFALMAYGMTQEYALGVAVMHHLVVFSLIVGWGLYCLWKEKMTFLELKKPMNTIHHFW
jgi:glycosyltransferase 2 family protein